MHAYSALHCIQTELSELPYGVVFKDSDFVGKIENLYRSNLMYVGPRQPAELYHSVLADSSATLSNSAEVCSR